MKTGQHIIIACLSGLCLLSCGKTVIEYESAIVPIVSIEESVPQVKSEIMGTDFPDMGTFGLFVCKHDSFTEYTERSNNIKACYFGSEGIWYYQYDSYSYWFTSLIFKSSASNRFVDVYAYSPFISNITDLTKIPFDSKSQQDLMFARENDSDANKNIDFAAEEHHVAQFKFAHALSLIEFSLKSNLDNSAVRLDEYYVTTTGEGPSALYSKGTFNALNGSIECDGTSDNFVSQKVVWDHSKTQNVYSDRRTSFYLLVPPVEIKGDDLVLGLKLNDVGGLGSGVNCIAVKKEDLIHSDGTTCGLRPGYKYKFELDIDNYVHLSGVSIDNTWTEKNIDKEI